MEQGSVAGAREEHQRNSMCPQTMGVINVWGIRRLVEDQRGDGERIMGVKGSPKDWRLDANEEEQLVELDDGGIPEADLERGPVRAEGQGK